MRNGKCFWRGIIFRLFGSLPDSINQYREEVTCKFQCWFQGWQVAPNRLSHARNPWRFSRSRFRELRDHQKRRPVETPHADYQLKSADVEQVRKLRVAHGEKPIQRRAVQTG